MTLVEVTMIKLGASAPVSLRKSQLHGFLSSDAKCLQPSSQPARGIGSQSWLVLSQRVLLGARKCCTLQLNRPKRWRPPGDAGKEWSLLGAGLLWSI